MARRGVNWCQRAIASPVVVNPQYVTGTIDNTIDDNLATKWTYTMNLYGTNSVSILAAFYWAKPVTIEQVSGSAYVNAWVQTGGSWNAAYCFFWCQGQHSDASWFDIDALHGGYVNTPRPGTFNRYEYWNGTSGDNTKTGPWTDVIAIFFYCIGGTEYTPSGGGQGCNGHIYEMRAEGPAGYACVI